MSIVIAVIDETGNNVYLASDRKGADMQGNFVEQEFLKTHKLKENLYFTGNGVYDTCMAVKDVLMSLTSIPEMIKYLDSLVIQTIEINGKKVGDCTFVLAGKYDDGEPFIYARITNTGNGHFLRSTQGRIIYVVAVENPDVAQELHSFLPKEINRAKNYEVGIKNTLHLASHLSESVGKKHDFIHLQSHLMHYNIN